MGTAAELFRHHAFVDLETTGLDPERDQVIEVGALFVERGSVVRRISKLFRSSAPLPLPIRRLTGIEDTALADAPFFETFAQELRQALSGWTVVAHNASFEQSFLAGLLKEIRAPVLDSCELLHYLYPELESYSLDSMIRWSGVGDRAAHRALKDCEDTLAMLCKALDRFVEDGRSADVVDLLECLVPAAPPLAQSMPTFPGLPMVELLSELAERCRSTAPGESLSEAIPSQCSSLPRSVQFLDAERISTPLKAGCAPPNGIHDTEESAELQMKWWVRQALEKGQVAAVEPSGGALQPRAYAAASAGFARQNNCRVAIAVGTPSRLHQLMGQEMPELKRADNHLSYSFLADQRQYLCRRRALDVAEIEAGMSYDERAPRAYLRAFLRRSMSGELGRLSYWFKGRYPILERLALAARSEPATTLGSRCAHYSRCFFHSALLRSRESNVLIVHQPLVAEWPFEYPKCRYLVIDEAHQLESALTAELSLELTNAALAGLRDRLLGVGGGSGLWAEIESELVKANGPSSAALQIRDGAHRSKALTVDAERLGDALSSVFALEEESPYRRERLMTADLQGSMDWWPVKVMLLELKTHLGELVTWLSALLDGLPHLANTKPGLERDIFGALTEARRLFDCASRLAGPCPSDRCLLASVDADCRSWILRSEPLDVSAAFARLVDNRTVLLSSPALSVGQPEPWILRRLGVAAVPERIPAHCGNGEASKPRTGVLILLVTDAPRPFDESFLDWASMRISGIAAFLGGHVMGLFSSHHRLVQVEERLRPRLEPSGIEVLRVPRGRPNATRGGKSSSRTVLLGSRALWHRAESEHDVACVFIDKLPIEPLSRGATSVREAAASKSCTDARYHAMPYRLPRALVLLRHWLATCAANSDGPRLVVIAHPGNPSHREALVAALEGYRHETLPWGKARVRIYDMLFPIAEHSDSARALPNTANA